MLTFDNLAEMMSEKIMTYISSFESTQFFDYAIYVVSAPNTSKKGENVKQGWDMAFS